MYTRNVFWAMVFCSTLAISGAKAGDDGQITTSLFDRVEQRYRSAKQGTVTFTHIVVSDFFETADTVNGEVSFADDGRYRTTLGSDVYLFDGNCLWEYSSVYAQATKNCLKPGQRIEDSFLFFRRFTDYYTVSELTTDSVYALKILEGKAGSAPDSLTLTISPSQERLLQMEYYDINDERNVVIIREERFAFQVTDSVFQVIFPDSTEIIVIPD